MFIGDIVSKNVICFTKYVQHKSWIHLSSYERDADNFVCTSGFKKYDPRCTDPEQKDCRNYLLRMKTSIVKQSQVKNFCFWKMVQVKKVWCLPLCESDTCFLDGTFYVTPSQFYQVFLIYVWKFQPIICVAYYGLLPDEKQKNTHERLFHLLKSKCLMLGYQSSFGCSHLSGVATADVFKRLHGRFGSVLRRMPFLTQPTDSRECWDTS